MSSSDDEVDQVLHMVAELSTAPPEQQARGAVLAMSAWTRTCAIERYCREPISCAVVRQADDNLHQALVEFAALLPEDEVDSWTDEDVFRKASTDPEFAGRYSRVVKAEIDLIVEYMLCPCHSCRGRWPRG